MPRLLRLLLAFALLLPQWGTPADPQTRSDRRVSGNHRPALDTSSTQVPNLFIMSETQPGLDRDKSKQIDDFKRRMADGTFDYSTNVQVSGQYHAPTQTYFVSEGHHRLAAALELAYETGNWAPFRKLIDTGYWNLRSELPPRRYRLTMRHSWYQALTCRQIISQISPPWGHLLFK